VAILNIIGNTNSSIGTSYSGSIPQPVPFIAFGGNITNFQSGSFIYTSHTFTSSGALTIERGQKLVDILLIGGGGGGRSGSVVGVGGEGGGAGGYLLSHNILLTTASAQIPYITASFNIAVGNGGAQNQNGTTSSISASYTYSGMPSYPIIAYGGGAGSGAAVATQANALMSGLGIFSALAGQSGNLGGTFNTFDVIYPTTGLLLSGGAGGGGTSSSFVAGVGSNIIVPTQTSFSLITARSGGTANNPGADGLSLLQPLMSIGGGGGGSSNSTTLNGIPGGRGGNGGLGSGGGGGGAGPSGTGGSGAGGRGGDGLVIIRSW
jgi:hypothetical protein